jgi:hypothetical protein
MGRMLELVDGAQESVRFTIFAFTKDQVGGALIRKQRSSGARRREGVAEPADPSAANGVAGVIDQSQLHSNGQYHEVYRLLGAGHPAAMDGNDNAQQPGDYQAGGGRLHSKTMIIDANGDNPVVITGSFNWSASATQSNDEYLLVFHGKRVAEALRRILRHLWDTGRRLGGERIGENDLKAGDVVINEVMWYGAHVNDVDGFDEFIELRNLTDRASASTCGSSPTRTTSSWASRPARVIPPGGRFTIVDHVLEPYRRRRPAGRTAPFLRGDLVVNASTTTARRACTSRTRRARPAAARPRRGDRQRAGDGGPAFAGGPAIMVPGTDTTYRDVILATPGEPEP